MEDDENFIDNKVSKFLLRFKVWQLTLAGIIIGIIMIIIAEETPVNKVQWLKLIIEHIGSILIAVITLHFIHDQYIKHEHLKVMRIQIKETVDLSLRAELEKLGPNIKNAISISIPEYFNKWKNKGIVDVHNELNIEYLCSHLKQLNSAKIYILTIWISDFFRIQDVIFDAIEYRNCTIHILILDPGQVEVIKRRCVSLEASLGVYPETFIDGIENNRKGLISIYNHLSPKVRDKLKCRFYNDWISVCIYGYDDIMLVGNYLMGKLAPKSHFFEISGKDTSVYQEYANHFRNIWRNSEKISSYDIFNVTKGTINTNSQE